MVKTRQRLAVANFFLKTVDGNSILGTIYSLFNNIRSK